MTWSPVGTLTTHLKCTTPPQTLQTVKRSFPPYLDAGMTAQVEVKFSRMGDFRVYGCACWNVPTLPNLQQQRELIRCGRGGGQSLTWAEVVVYTAARCYLQAVCFLKDLSAFNRLQ